MSARKRGCPTCCGIAPKSCLRCHGQTVLAWWHDTPEGEIYAPPTKTSTSATDEYSEGIEK